MLFREHPKLTCSGVSIWPPALVGSRGEKETICAADNAVLKNIRYFKVSTSEGPKLLLEFTCGEQICSSTIKLDHPVYVMPLFEWLKNQRGKTITEIGNSEIEF
jgi:hypothetical protein